MFEGIDQHARGPLRSVFVCGLLSLALMADAGCAHRTDVVATGTPAESVASSGSSQETTANVGAPPETVASVSQPPREVLPFIHDDFARAANEARARKLPLLVEAWAGW